MLYTEEDILEILLTTSRDDYTFLSCGDPYIEPPDFLALFIPFTKLTWALIFMTIFGWPLVLSLIENDFKLKNVVKDFDALFIGWAMILEQSHLRATNYKGRGPLYCYCGCVLLAILILSNAYKGDNFRTLTKSFELIPLTQMDQVKKAGYKTHSKKECVPFSGYFPNKCQDEFYLESYRSKHQYTDKQFKMWKPIGHEFFNETSGHYHISFFGRSCKRKALLGWRRYLAPLEKELRRKHRKAEIYLGEEFIFTQRLGWHLSRYGNVKVLKRMWTIVESGVHGKLLNISYKPRLGKVFEPHRLTIHGNISVQFVYHSCGLLLALLIFIVEARKLIAMFRVRVCFLMRSFLISILESLLDGLKYHQNIVMSNCMNNHQ